MPTAPTPTAPTPTASPPTASPTAPTVVPWSVDRLTRAQREFLAQLHDRDRALVIPIGEFHPSVAWPLRSLGLITVDTGLDEDSPIVIALTAAGSKARER